MSNDLNVVYIHSHDTGRCMEPYGFPISMPAYQRIAREGIVFRRAFSASPTCSPSRAALLTGQSPHSAGMLGLAHRGFSLTEPSQHLAAYLGQHGYQTVLAGHQHLTTADPRTLGYDVVSETTEIPGDRVAAHAVDFLANRSHQSEPFFLDVGFSEAHRPFREAAKVPIAGYRYCRVCQTWRKSDATLPDFMQALKPSTELSAQCWMRSKTLTWWIPPSLS